MAGVTDGVTERLLIANAVSAHQVVADGLASLRKRMAPSLTSRGFPRSRAFAGMIREASVAVVCGLAFACSARDRGMVGRQLARLPLLEQALDPKCVPLADDEASVARSPIGDQPALWHELKAMLGSFRDAALDGLDGTLEFGPLLCGLPAEIELSDAALTKALYLMRGGAEGTIDYAGIAIRSLGDIYEALVGRTSRAREDSEREKRANSRRKAAGMYYTPEVIVRYIVSGTLGRLVGGSAGDSSPDGEPLSVRAILNLKILDPAAGSGHFLIAAAEYLARACLEAAVREGGLKDCEAERARALGEYRRLVAERCIYGVDIDPVAVELARLSLRLFASDPGTSDPGTPSSGAASHLRCGNSLHRFHWADEFPDARQGFDTVIGNPPYLSFSGRQKPPGNEWIEQLESIGTPGGWRSMHGLFMLKSLELAKGSGLVSMVVPDQVGHLKGYKPLRSRMLEQGRLLEVRYWGEGVFGGVTSPALTFIVRKSGPTPLKTIMIAEDGSMRRFSPAPGEEWFTSPSREVLQRMAETHIVLKTFSDPGVHTGNIARKLVLSRPAGGSVSLLEGRQVHPFRCEEPRLWLDLSLVPGQGEYFRVSAEETYRSTDILLRQTASRPVAARHVFRCHFRNSVLALKAPGGFSVEYLLGVLNSAAAAFLYRASSFESRQRAFPQVKIRLLRGLPIPDPRLGANRSRVSEVEDLVRRIESGAGLWMVASGADRPGGGAATVISRLDTLVWSLYGFSGPPR